MMICVRAGVPRLAGTWWRTAELGSCRMAPEGKADVARMASSVSSHPTGADPTLPSECENPPTAEIT